MFDRAAGEGAMGGVFEERLCEQRSQGSEGAMWLLERGAHLGEGPVGLPVWNERGQSGRDEGGEAARAWSPRALLAMVRISDFIFSDGTLLEGLKQGSDIISYV